MPGRTQVVAENANSAPSEANPLYARSGAVEVEAKRSHKNTFIVTKSELDTIASRERDTEEPKLTANQ